MGVLSFANSFDTKVYVGATAGKIDKHNYSQFGIGYTANKKFDNKEIFNVFGHTPISKVDINEYKANIDLGCVYGITGNGLCALEFPSLKIFTQKNIE